MLRLSFRHFASQGKKSDEPLIDALKDRARNQMGADNNIDAKTRLDPWETKYNASSGKVYYEHAKTGEQREEKPVSRHKQTALNLGFGGVTLVAVGAFFWKLTNG